MRPFPGSRWRARICFHPGWIKVENGQRSPSEKLIEKLVTWLVSDKHVKSSKAKGLKEELLTLKYLGSNSLFMRELAKTHAKTLPTGEALLAPTTGPKPKRGRPKMTPAK